MGVSRVSPTWSKFWTDRRRPFGHAVTTRTTRLLPTVNGRVPAARNLKGQTDGTRQRLRGPPEGDRRRSDGCTRERGDALLQRTAYDPEDRRGRARGTLPKR